MEGVMNPVTATPACPRCGATLAADAPQGLCPRCLMALNLDTETVLQPSGASGHAPPAPAIEDLAPHFPQLEIMECLGRGGMGVVYKARQKSLERHVALKLLAPERAEDPAFAQRFGREARALAALNHPNIVTVHDFGQAGGYYFLLMEYVDGVNLRQAMRAERFSPEQALAMVPPICDALQYAHERGVVHRDIKPENLLLDKEGRLKIADFGIARIIGGAAEPAGEHAPNKEVTMAAGTPAYMAPEQAANPAAADHRADIYSLGVVLYELLTGERPKETLEPPSRRVSIDVRLDEVVLRALEKEPERRYATAAEFRTRVETVAGAVRKTEPKPPRGVQKILQNLLPAHWFEAVRLQSHDWHMVCPCGHELSVWDAGGIRFGASGNPRRKMFCPACHKFRWFTTIWRGPSAAAGEGLAAQPQSKPTVSLGITLFFVFVTLMTLALQALPGGGDWKVTLPVSLGLPLAILFPIFWLGSWDLAKEGAKLGAYLKGFALLAWLVALPLIGFGIFFLQAMLTSTDAWNPAFSEAVAVPLVWIGALALPLAGARLWLAGRRLKPSQSQRSSLLKVGCIVALAVALSLVVGLIVPFVVYLMTQKIAPGVRSIPRGSAEVRHQAEQEKREKPAFVEPSPPAKKTERDRGLQPLHFQQE
jgi:tRNA A-37 threonylcarbamoyl transferase component Bud32